MLLINFYIGQAQQQPCPPVGTTTNPVSPVDLRGEPFLNVGDFDWMTLNYVYFPASTGPSTSFLSPFKGTWLTNIVFP